MHYKILFAVTFFLMSLTNLDLKEAYKKTNPELAANTKTAFETKAEGIYAQLNANHFAMPAIESFKQALEGFYNLKEKGMLNKDILTLVDFSLSSKAKRLWVIDLSTNTILFNSLVAHGRNSGMEYAQTFSNKNDSFKSSLGLYVTGEVYNGKHGMSMKLDGQEPGVNDNARSRSVVMHGADYVSESVVRMQNRLGRSLGCPAIPVELTGDIINTIKDKSVLFIYHQSRNKKSFGSLS
jgi:hypothetical protein